MDAVVAYGQLLIDDPDRFADVEAIGLDETLMFRQGRWRRQQWSTQIVDVMAGQLLDVVPDRNAAAPTAWLAGQSEGWRNGIRWATLDLSGPYRKVFDTVLPDAHQVADPFHLVKVRHEALCVRGVRGPGTLLASPTGTTRRKRPSSEWRSGARPAKPPPNT